MASPPIAGTPPDTASIAPSPTDYAEGDQHCLFVANLPQRMTNEELAMALLSIFKPFGEVLSVKASRDHRGRPFGFVEYGSGDAAASALAYAPFLTLDSRRIRVENAKRQRKLCIKWMLTEFKVEVALEEMRRVLQLHVSEEDFKLSLQQPTSYDSGLEDAADNVPEQVVAAVVKFEDPQVARKAFEAWQVAHPEWSMTWINMDRSAMGSNVRNSGLVQLVPGKDGNNVFLTSPSMSTSGSRFSSPPPLPIPMAPQLGAVFDVPRFMPAYEEQSYTDRESDLSEQLDKSLAFDELPQWLNRTLFVGRLNGQYVTIPQLYEKFRVYGGIDFIRLYNRGVVGFDGVPVDAYALIRYTEGEASVQRAIKAEHGKAWLGQACKCEPARPGALTMLLHTAGNSVGNQRSATPFVPVAFYFPAMMNGGNGNGNGWAFANMNGMNMNMGMGNGGNGMMLSSPVISRNGYSPQNNPNNNSNWYRAKPPSPPKNEPSLVN